MFGLFHTMSGLYISIISNQFDTTKTNNKHFKNHLANVLASLRVKHQQLNTKLYLSVRKGQFAFSFTRKEHWQNIFNPRPHQSVITSTSIRNWLAV